MSVAGSPDQSVAPSPAGAPARRHALSRAMSRRVVLGAAVAGGAGMAAARLLGLDRAITTRLESPAQSRTDWNSPLGAERARVAHLLRRTGFGASPDELEAATAAGFSRTVDRLLESRPAPPPELPAAAIQGGYGLNVPELQLWWIQHMLTTQTPFAERMTLFLHGHFTSDFRKVGTQTPYMHWQNLTWREMALTDLRSMLLKVTTDPAMLRYLDLAQSTSKSPNENYSREVMELFTMGAGNFTETDVRNGARAFAGWVEPKPTSMVTVTLDPKNNVVRKYPVWDRPYPGTLDPKRSYSGPPLTFLGKAGVKDAEGAIDAILARPETALYMTTRVMQSFAMARPPDAEVKRVAARFRATKYDMKTLMSEIFRSPQFVAPAAYRALVKSPTEFMVHTLKALKAPQLARMAVAAGPGMGQQLFDPPDVGGWPNNDSWISSNDVMARVNYVSGVLNAMKALPPAADVHQQQLDDVLSPQTAALMSQASDDHTRWFLALASPEFQLK